MEGSALLQNIPETTFKLFINTALKYPDRIAIGGRYKGEEVSYTYAQLLNLSKACACGLLGLGLKKGDHIGIITSNRVEWYILDLAASQLGIVNVSLFPNYDAPALQHILKDAGISYLFVANNLFYKMAKPALNGLDNIKGIVSFEEAEGLIAFNSLLNNPANEQYAAEVEAISNTITPDDTYCIFYTSGTGGNPKGAVTMHKGICHAAVYMGYSLGLTAKDKAVGFLSISHAYERGHHFAYMHYGTEIYIGDMTTGPMENINYAKPTVFTAVPLMLERLFAGITAGADKDEAGKKALDMAINYEFGDEEKPEFIQAKKAFYDGWKAKFGSNLTRIACAGAPLPAWLNRFYWAIGIPIHEIYGLSECFSVTYTRNRETAKFGTVGAISIGTDIKFADDGEILYRGPFLMKGFHNLPEYTKQVIDEDGFFHTGDLGELVDGHFIRITGRKKDVFKVVSGYYVSPPLIEEKINASAYIARCIVFPRNGRVGLIIQPEYNLLAEELGMNPAELAKPEHNGLVLDKIRTEVDKHYNTHVMDAERVAEYYIDPVAWSVEGGELTPTMKIKREVIIKKLEII